MCPSRRVHCVGSHSVHSVVGCVLIGQLELCVRGDGEVVAQWCLHMELQDP